MTDLQANIQAVRSRIEQAANRVGRDPDQVTLVAVTKSRPIEVLQAIYDMGVRTLGENRVEEAEGKIPLMPADISWHMIGHIQSRKAKRVVPLFDAVHSVDSVKLARRLDRLCGEQGRQLQVLLEFNVSGEQSKYGFAANRWREDPSQWQAVCAAVHEIANLVHLDVQGLMTMAPIVKQPEDARPFFILLRNLRDQLASQFPTVHWQHLSMGMTDDFEVAIEEGATMVRVGRAIFAPEEPIWCALPPK
jgi:pyridoxal phosphate enzyme (YggS family)